MCQIAEGMPPTEQIFIGAVTAVLCLMGIAKSRWVLDNTQKGTRLASWFGPSKAIWVLRGLFGLGAVFGILLAANLLKPIQW